MSTPNPILVAGAPSLIMALEELQTAVTTIITGAPEQAAARVLPALEILLAKLTLQLPGLATAELAAGGALVNTKISGFIAQLKAL